MTRALHKNARGAMEKALTKTNRYSSRFRGQAKMDRRYSTCKRKQTTPTEQVIYRGGESCEPTSECKLQTQEATQPCDYASVPDD